MAADRVYPAAKTPVSVIIDTLNHTYEQVPFTYGDVLEDDQFNRGGESRVSREYDGERFIYSFYSDEAIYATSVDHKKVQKINAKSKYIDWIMV